MEGNYLVDIWKLVKFCTFPNWQYYSLFLATIRAWIRDWIPVAKIDQQVIQYYAPVPDGNAPFLPLC